MSTKYHQFEKTLQIGDDKRMYLFEITETAFHVSEKSTNKSVYDGHYNHNQTDFVLYLKDLRYAFFQETFRKVLKKEAIKQKFIKK